MIAPARRAATEVLAAVDAGRWDLATALAQVHPSLADARDRALLTELATGVQRWKLALDFAIHALTKRQPADLDRGCARDAAARAVPVAACHADPGVGGGQRRGGDRQARADAKRVRHGQRRAPSRRPRGTADAARGATRAGRRSSLANAGAGVARDHAFASRLARRALAGSLRLRGDRSVGALRQHAGRRDGVAAGAAGIGNRESGVGSRAVGIASPRCGLATSKARRRGSCLAGSCWRADAMRCRTCAAGSAYAQDEASAAVGVVAGTVGRGRVLDACASPGGKSLAMRPWLPPDARLVANDMRVRRVALLAATLARASGATAFRSCAATRRTCRSTGPSTRC